ncbi:MAG TPA: MFS transporter [Anaerolineales bacterium]
MDDTITNPKPGSLWRNSDFLKLWSGQTISVFGSMIGGTAMSFTALLFLQATPFQMALLSSMQLVPGFLAGLFAGAWVDRVRRRPMMIAVDISRAVIFGTIPLAALMGILHIEQLYLVALAVGILTIIFELAYQAYLPSLVGKQHVVEGNSKLSASAAVAEFGGFNLGGWLVHIFTAPFAILIDAVSFLASALSLHLIRAHEMIEHSQESPNMLREIREGLRVVYQHSLLRSSAVVLTIISLSGGIFSALVVLYMGRELGFDPGILGMIWAVGGVSSFFGASLTPYLTRRLNPGPAMVAGLALYSVSIFFIPLASGATVLSAIFLIIQQLGDGFFVLYEINMVSFRQEIISERMLGRVNATLRFVALGATLVGTLLGGLLGESLGVRTTLFIAAGGSLIGSAILAISPIGKLKKTTPQE